MGSIPVSFESDVFYPGGQRIHNQQVSVLECYGCHARTVVIEDKYVGGVRHGTSGTTTWHGIHSWPTPGAGTFDPAVPAPIAIAYDEAVRCLSAGAPNGAAALLRNALALIVADKGSEAAGTAAHSAHSATGQNMSTCTATPAPIPRPTAP